MDREATARVLVVDDHQPFRRAVRALLDRADGLRWVGEASTGEEAIELSRDLEPDLVLMDVNLPGVDGIVATRQLRDRAPGTVVVLCSTYAEADLPSAAGSCGAAAYLHKSELDASSLRSLWRRHRTAPDD